MVRHPRTKGAQHQTRGNASFSSYEIADRNLAVWWCGLHSTPYIEAAASFLLQRSAPRGRELGCCACCASGARCAPWLDFHDGPGGARRRGRGRGLPEQHKARTSAPFCSCHGPRPALKVSQLRQSHLALAAGVKSGRSQRPRRVLGRAPAAQASSSSLSPPSESRSTSGMVRLRARRKGDSTT